MQTPTNFDVVRPAGIGYMGAAEAEHGAEDPGGNRWHAGGAAGLHGPG